MDIKVGDLVLIEEGIYKGEKATVKNILNSMLRLCVCSKVTIIRFLWNLSM